MTTPTDQELEKVAREKANKAAAQLTLNPEKLGRYEDIIYHAILSALKQVQPSLSSDSQKHQSTGPSQPEQTGIALIASERQRQVSEEGWTPEHDNTHNKGELALLAVYYALDESQRKEWSKKTGRNFSADWLKPTPHDRVRELIKAGALIAAEIDRLKRVPSLESTSNDAAEGKTCLPKSFEQVQPTKAGICRCGHFSHQHLHYSDHDECQECECDQFVSTSPTKPLVDSIAVSPQEQTSADAQNVEPTNETCEDSSVRRAQPKWLMASLEALKDNPDERGRWLRESVVIWQGDHGGAWWRANGAGYTVTESEAAIYDFKDAWRRTSHCGPEKQIKFLRVPPPASTPANPPKEGRS